MLNLLRRSGVGHVKAKQYGKMFLSEEIDETILASLDFGHTNTFLRASGVRSGLDRHKIYSCFSTSKFSLCALLVLPSVQLPFAARLTTGLWEFANINNDLKVFRVQYI